MAKKGYIEVVLSGGEHSTEERFTKHKFIGRYRYGIVQPGTYTHRYNTLVMVVIPPLGVLCITKDRDVLFKWAIDPQKVCMYNMHYEYEYTNIYYMCMNI